MLRASEDPLRIAMIHQLEGGGATVAARALSGGALRHGWEIAWFPDPQAASLAALEQGLAAFRPDVLHLHCWYQSYPLKAWSRWLEIAPIAFTVHDVFIVNQFGDECWECYRPAHCLGCPALPLSKRYRPNVRVRQRMGKRWLFGREPRATLILPSRWMQRRLARSEWRRAPQALIPYAVQSDDDTWESWLSAPRAPSSNPTVVFVGNMYSDADHRKGLPDLLAAWPRVRQAVPDAVLQVIGDIRTPIDLPVGTSVLGPTPRDRVRELLSSAHALCLPSRGDNSPLAVIEAQALGVPVVATAVGGIPELLADGAGVLSPARQPDQLAGALLTVLEDRALQGTLSAAGRARARTAHRPSAVTASHDRLYRALRAPQ